MYHPHNTAVQEIADMQRRIDWLERDLECLALCLHESRVLPFPARSESDDAYSLWKFLCFLQEAHPAVFGEYASNGRAKSEPATTEADARTVAQMQRHIDDLEACVENGFLNIKSEHLYHMTKKEGCDLYDVIWEFLAFIHEKHPDVLREFNGRQAAH